MTERLIGYAYRLGWVLVRLMPEALARRLFRAFADRAWRRRGPRVVQLERNLARVVGPDLPESRLRELSREGMRSYARYWCEVFRLPSIKPERILGAMEVHDGERLAAARESGRGIILALPHTGNWDHAGAWAVLAGMPHTTVAERLRPAELFDRFVAFRESLGMEVLPLDGGAERVFGVLAKRLRDGRVVTLVADRDLTTSGVKVDFFGERTSMPAGPATLALRTGAVLLPITLWFTPRGWAGQVHPPVEPPQEGTYGDKVAAMTQAVADAFASGIAEHPQDWHMLQPLWLADLPEHRRRRLGG